MLGGTIPRRARAVVVGAGIAGCSVAYHLTQLGWRDVVVVDQGPLFETGRLDVPRPGPRFPGQPLEDDDELCSLHRRPVVAAGARRRSVRQVRGQPGGGLDA